MLAACDAVRWMATQKSAVGRRVTKRAARVVTRRAWTCGARKRVAPRPQVLCNGGSRCVSGWGGRGSQVAAMRTR